MKENKNYYITTPIYYPSARLHLGSAYTTIACDVLKRYKMSLGYDVFFLTGSDEHGEKIEKKAKEEGVTPLEYTTEIVKGIKELWKSLDIEYDKFIRTTDKDHEEQVKYIFDKLLKQGDIYKDKYVGLYCTPCESFFSEAQLVDGKCPDCGREVYEVEEESYFFDCSKYVDRLMDHYEKNPNFILPLSRKNELINSFIKPGLENLAVSRTSFEWGVPVPGDEKHVIYVWIDALSNYITALNYKDNDELFNKYWPADVHMMGKDIIRFHAIYWPMILMALDLPLPKQLFAHGFLLIKNDKMSKSKGNVIYPEFLIENYGSDTLRYYLLREVPFGFDGSFTPATYIKRINNDIINDLGNLVHRTVVMVNKYFDSEVKYNQEQVNSITVYKEMNVQETIEQFHKLMDEVNFSKSLDLVWSFISNTNKVIDLTAPWVLYKENKLNELEAVLFILLDLIRKITIFIDPFMPNTATFIRKQLNLEENISFETINNIPTKYLVTSEPSVLMQRLEAEVEVEKIEQEMAKYLEI